MNLAVDNRYKSQARLMLQNSFQHISCAAIDSAFSASNFNFNDAFYFLSNIEAQRDATDGHGAGHFNGIPPRLRVFLRRERPRKNVTLTERDERLRGEIDAIPELNTKEKEVIDLTSDTEDEDSIVVEDVKELEVECLCCFGDYVPSETRECEPGSGHRVCKECIYRYVSEQLDGNDSASFTCIVDTNCQNNYSLSLLDQVLSPKLNKRANDRVFREEMKKAGIKSWTCPHCAYIGFNGYSERIPWIECPECSIKYCTKCNEVHHKGKTCDDIRREKERERDPKRRAHEAMTQACKRFCPHCNQEYQKSDGCNKIRCKCRLLSCYLCGEKIEDYSHFCNHKLPEGATKCRCGKPCRLWTDSTEMDQMDRTKRQEAGRKALAEAGVTDEKEILSILASPPKKVVAAGNAEPPARPAVVPAPVRQAAPRPVRAPAPHNGAGQPVNAPARLREAAEVRAEGQRRIEALRAARRARAGEARQQFPAPQVAPGLGQALPNQPIPPAPPIVREGLLAADRVLAGAAQMPAVPDRAGLHQRNAAAQQHEEAAGQHAEDARQRPEFEDALNALENGQCVIQ